MTMVYCIAMQKLVNNVKANLLHRNRETSMLCWKII